MKSEKNILLAFLLNLSFSIFEFFGGIFCGSVAIISDAMHDIGDAASIALSYFFEKKSKRKPDECYTYGYGRFSVLGGAITTFILLVGSLAVISGAINRIVHPYQINYNGMIIFAVVGTIVNLSAAFFTRHGDSVNQKAVNLHMLEDVLGWIVVLIGAIVMKFTGIQIIDPIMCIGVSIFILINALKNLKEILDILLLKTPKEISVTKTMDILLQISGVIYAHHIHLWSVDGHNVCATMHIVTSSDPLQIKQAVREKLREHGIFCTTIELESADENCHYMECHITPCENHMHHH